MKKYGKKKYREKKYGKKIREKKVGEKKYGEKSTKKKCGNKKKYGEKRYGKKKYGTNKYGKIVRRKKDGEIKKKKMEKSTGKKCGKHSCACAHPRKPFGVTRSRVLRYYYYSNTKKLEISAHAQGITSGSFSSHLLTCYQ